MPVLARSRIRRGRIIVCLRCQVVQVLGTPDHPVRRSRPRCLLGFDGVLDIALSRARPIGRRFDRVVEGWVTFHAESVAPPALTAAHCAPADGYELISAS